MLSETRETTRTGRGSAGPVVGVVQGEGEEETRQEEGEEDEETRWFGFNLLEEWGAHIKDWLLNRSVH